MDSSVDLILTRHLTSFPTPRPYAAAIAHPFLTAAGAGTLSPALLALYLSQDRIYAAHAYPRFIGLLISRIPFSSSDELGSAAERRNERILKVLSYALENVVREVEFFRETAEKWGLDIEGWRERKGTRDYTAEMGRVGTMEEGLVFLWAMEQVYLDAWTNVQRSVAQQTGERSTAAAATAALAANWSRSNVKFVEFVDELADIVNGLGIDRRSAEGVWGRVVELEEAFWPQSGDERSYHK